MKIGVGVTLSQTKTEWKGLQLCSDDTSVTPVFGDTTIAIDKNCLIKHCYDAGREYIFIFDDDTFPIKKGWEMFFIAASKRTGVQHFILGNDEHLQMIGFENGLNYFRKGTGCMLFLTRQVIEKVGYLNNKYGRYGFEHATYSHRIHKAGLTPSWYCSVEGWEEYVYSWDLQKEDAGKHGFVKEEWATPEEKTAYIEENQALYRKEMTTRNIYLDYEQLVPVRKTKARVLYYALQAGDTTSNQRIHGVLPYIQHNDFFLIDISYEHNFNETPFKGVSLLIFQRPFTPDHVKLIMLAKQCNVPVICDYDDNVLAVDMFNPTYQMYQQYQGSILECIKMADELWVSTEAIKESYKHFNTYVVPNSHNDYVQPIEDKLSFKSNKKVLYRGGMSHRADVYQYSEMLVEVINKNKSFNFLFMGDRYEWLEQRTGDNHHIIPGVSIGQYYNFVYNENPSIFIFPLCDTPFNRAKSNIAFLECVYVGAAFFGTTSLPEFNVPGASDIKMLPEAINGEHWQYMKEQNEIGWKYVLDNLLLSKINLIRIERILANI